MLFRLISTLRAFKSNWQPKSLPLSVLFVAIIKNIQYIMFGNSQAIDRLRVCQTCEFNDKEFCVLCTCYIPAAVLHKAHKCPMGRWKE